MPPVDCDRASEDVNTDDTDGNVSNETSDDSLVSSCVVVADEQCNDVHIESIACEPVVCDLSAPVSGIDVVDDVLPTVTACVAVVIVYDEDQDFGYIDPVPGNLGQPEEIQWPSKHIDMESLKHLSPQQQKELLLSLLDKYPVFP